LKEAAIVDAGRTEGLTLDRVAVSRSAAPYSTVFLRRRNTNSPARRRTSPIRPSSARDWLCRHAWISGAFY